jgi:ferredoxin
VEASLRYPEIEVLHPLINMTGVGIADGTRDMMLAAIQKAKAQGKGIFAMKPLGGGHLIAKREEAMQFMLNQACIDSIAMGMQTIPEVHYNCAVFSGETPDPELAVEIGFQSRRLMIHDWCEGCGACVKTCKNHALTLDGGRARVDAEACVLCGYCARVCPQFCIKVI